MKKLFPAGEYNCTVESVSEIRRYDNGVQLQRITFKEIPLIMHWGKTSAFKYEETHDSQSPEVGDSMRVRVLITKGGVVTWNSVIPVWENES